DGAPAGNAHLPAATEDRARPEATRPAADGAGVLPTRPGIDLSAGQPSWHATSRLGSGTRQPGERAMPGIYAADRQAAPGRGGLLLHYTPHSTGPLTVNVDTANFLDLAMSEPWVCPASEWQGIRTDSMSDCIVVSVTEWTPDGWGWTYFHHIAGGY